jgi:hypothetical protein
MVSDLHNLDKIEGAFKISEQIAIHASRTDEPSAP